MYILAELVDIFNAN